MCVMRSPMFLVREYVVRMTGLLMVGATVSIGAGGLKLEMNCLYVVDK